MPNEFIAAGTSDGASSQHSTLPTSTALTSHNLNSHTDVDTAGVVTDDCLCFDGIEWGPVPPSSLIGLVDIDDLADVNLSSPTLNDLFTFDGADWVNTTPASVAATFSLNDIGDVVTGGPGANDLFQFNGVNWVSATVSAVLSVGVLNDIGDVVAGSPGANDCLCYNGANWVPSTPAVIVSNGIGSSDLNDLGDVNAPSPGIGDRLEWTGVAWVPVTPATVGVGIYEGTVAIGPSGTNPIAWSGELKDTNNRHSTVTNTSRITVAVGESVVRMSARIYTSMSTTLELQLKKNGVVLSRINGGFFEVKDGTGLGFTEVFAQSAALDVIPGDYFEVRSNIAPTEGWMELEVLE